MTNEELDNYMKKVNPNFDSHIEKGTIEMNNEYYNLLEEKMARLINENQELKKQLTTYQILHRDCMVDNLKNISKIEEKENQQKDFINYLEDEIKIYSNTYMGEMLKELKEILQKYKEIIGGND